MAKSTIEEQLVKSYWWTIPISYIFEAFVLSRLWNWYAPHLIGQAHHIGLAAAFGIVLIVELFRPIKARDAAITFEKTRHQIVSNIALMALILLVGYLVHYFFL